MKLWLVGSALLLAACAVTTPRGPSGHVGPIASLAIEEGTLWSCSVAGVFRGVDDGLELVGTPPFRPFAVEPSADGWILVTGGIPGERGSACILDPAGQVREQRDVADDLAYAAAMNPAGDRALIGCADGRVLELSLPGLETLAEPARHSAPARAVAWSDDGRYWASGGLDGNLFLGSGTMPPVVLVDHTAGVECLEFVGASIASGSRDGRVRVHSLRGELLLSTDRLAGGAVLAIAASGVDSTIGIGMAGGQLLEFDFASRTMRHVDALAAPIHSLVHTADGWVAGTAQGIRRVR